MWGHCGGSPFGVVVGGVPIWVHFGGGLHLGSLCGSHLGLLWGGSPFEANLGVSPFGVIVGGVPI